MRNRLWLMVLLLWGLWAMRAHTIMKLPVFVDESLHILRAQVVFEFTDAKASILPAKLLLYYYLGIFDPQNVGGAWLSRQAIALLAPLGAALSYALARSLFQRQRVGLFTMILYGLTPFMFFFERMALSDSFVMIFSLALAIVAIKLAKQPKRTQAIRTGVALGIAMLAKLTATPLLVLPPLAGWLFGRWSFTHYRQTLFTVGMCVLVLFIPSLTYMVYQEIDPPENKTEAVEQDLFLSDEHTRIEQIQYNIETYFEASRAMFSDFLLVLIIALGLWQFTYTPKSVLYLIAFTALIWVPITLTSVRPSARYLVPGVPTLLIIVAAGLDSLFRHAQTSSQQRMIGAIAAFFMLGWGVYGVRFFVIAWDDPIDLPLATREIWEYYRNSASGYTLNESAHDLANLENLENHPSNAEIPVVGFVGACHTIRLYLPANSGVVIECPYFKWKPEFEQDILQEWENRVNEAGVWYVLADLEQPMEVFSLPFNWEELASYSRPHNGIGTKLFRVTRLETP